MTKRPRLLRFSALKRVYKPWHQIWIPLLTLIFVLDCLIDYPRQIPECPPAVNDKDCVKLCLLSGVTCVYLRNGMWRLEKNVEGNTVWEGITWVGHQKYEISGFYSLNNSDITIVANDVNGNDYRRKQSVYTLNTDNNTMVPTVRNTSINGFSIDFCVSYLMNRIEM